MKASIFAPETRKWWTLAAVAFGLFMIMLDNTVVNVALPTIQADLGIGLSELEWIVTGYALSFAALMLTGGKVADMVGRRRVFVIGIVVFTGASFLCGIAESSELLIGARVLQGVGAALMNPATLSIISATFPPEQRGMAIGIWAGVSALALAIGPLVGGLLTEHVGWEWIFFINVPVGLAVGLSLTRAVPAPAAPRAPRAQLDLPGAGTVMAGLLALVYAIQGTADHGWTSARTLIALSIAAALLAAFAAIERAARNPLLPPATWRVRSLISSTTVMLGATGILVGTFFLNTLFLQEVLDASALETGLAFLPLALVILAAAHVASHLLSHLGTRIVMAAGLLLGATGALLLTGAPTDATYATELLPGFVALGFGIGLTFVSVSVTAMHDVGHEQAGLASGLLTTGHEIGAALGVAVLGSVAAASASSGTAAGIADGYGDGFLVAAAMAALLAVAALLTVPSVRPAGGARVSLH
ncbi:MAG TPA: MFS transporter [Gaiellaceae bacterium]|nr:MFS transporter [Gaiellaceae bacterium]